MEQTETLIRLYTALLKNQELISPPPTLHLTQEQLEQNPDPQMMLQDLTTVMCALLGVPAGTKDPKMLVDNLNQRYPNPTSFWRAFLTEIIGILAPDKKPSADAALMEQGRHILKQLNDYMSDRNSLIAVCEKKIKEAGYPVDAHALLLNYINMSRKQPDQAWNLFTTTPAYFSPIITIDSKGKTVISADKGKQWNEQLAHFLKNLNI